MSHHGIAKIPDIVAVMQLNELSVVALQELNLFSCPGFASACLRHNCIAVLGELSRQRVCRANIISNAPVRPVTLGDITQADRYAAGVIEWHRGATVDKLIIYAPCMEMLPISGWPANLFRNLCLSINSVVDGSSCIGDFNLVATDPAIAEIEASGQACCLDSKFGPLELWPATGPGRRCRIDFGLCSKF